MIPKLLLALSLLLAVANSAMAAGTTYVPCTLTPPAAQREFRGAWIATVANIDWPSKPGMPVEEQKAELITILERATKLNLNAIIFQVRPACDAMYASKIEPWSYYLTGAMGKAPKPYYDPLSFAVAEAHKRGLELHAWFNPYRAGHPSNKSPISASHISKTHPNLVRQYGEYLWLDPGEKEVQDYSLRVLMDVVNRYDIDGVALDDYFYPYPIPDAQKKDIEFPDQASWKKFGISSKLSRDDWRRENVNTFVQRLYQSIKAAKPWVKFGISPFGIWQPGNPPQIKGLNAYEKLYCDCRKWLANGWMDYCAPQLYWAIQAPDQSYPVLLKWWEEQNPRHRNLWPAIDSGKFAVKSKPEEIINQMRLTRGSSAAPGTIHWSMKCLMENRGGLATELSKLVYSEPALVPPSPWLGTNAPGQPKLSVHSGGKLKWEPAAANKISWWVVQTKSGDRWSTSILPGEARAEKLTTAPEAIAVTAIDRCGVASLPTVLQRTASPN
jgi:uncharacterized lipoprotein YddW (UPF0748 family)